MNAMTVVRTFFNDFYGLDDDPHSNTGRVEKAARVECDRIV